MLPIEVRLEIHEAELQHRGSTCKDFAVVLDNPTKPLTFLISQSADLKVTYNRGSITATAITTWAVPTLQLIIKTFLRATYQIHERS